MGEEKIEVSKDMYESFIRDWQKKDVDPKERADTLKEFMVQEKMTQRAFEKRFGIDKSTVHDWLLLSKFTDDEIKTMKKTGMSKTDIYRYARSPVGKKHAKDNEQRIKSGDSILVDSPIERTYNPAKYNKAPKSETPLKINVELEIMNSTLRQLYKEKVHTDAESIGLLYEVRNMVNKFLMRIEKR